MLVVLKRFRKKDIKKWCNIAKDIKLLWEISREYGDVKIGDNEIIVRPLDPDVDIYSKDFYNTKVYYRIRKGDDYIYKYPKRTKITPQEMLEDLREYKNLTFERFSPF